MKDPRVSIILTSYNHESFIGEAIESALEQQFAGFELLIWDDGSTDNSWEIIQRYTDPRIQAIRSYPNSCIRDFNQALRRGRGQYIAIHHSDDRWHPHKLAAQVKVLDESAAIGACFTHVETIDQHGQLIENSDSHYTSVFNQPNRTRHEWLRHFFFHGNALCHPSILIRRECYETLGAYNEGLFQLPDFHMWIRLCLNYEIEVIPQKLTQFRVDTEHQSSMSAPTIDRQLRTRHEFFHVLQAFRSLSLDDLLLAFPQARAHQGHPQSQSVVDYMLAMVALTSEESTDVQRSFGANLLTECWMDDDMRNMLYSVHGLTRHQLIDKSLLVDHANITRIFDLANRLNEVSSQLQINKSNAHSHSKTAALLNEIRQSNSSTILKEIHRAIQERSFHLFTHILYDIRSLLGEKSCTYLEIGSYCGASALLMLAHPMPTEVICIDPLNLPASHYGGTKDQDQTLYDNLTQLGKRQSFEIIRSTSQDPSLIEALYRQGVSIDILFIDGDHRYASVVADFLLYEPLVASGGFIVFDDYHDEQYSPDVFHAVNDLMTRLVNDGRYEIVGVIPDLQCCYSTSSSGNEFVIYKK